MLRRNQWRRKYRVRSGGHENHRRAGGEEYDEAVRGFRGAIPKEAVTVYDMDGDIERGRKQLDEIDSKLKPDLVFAVGIWALRAVVSRPPSAPVVYAMVLNPPSVIS